MERFSQRHADRIVGVLSGFDRVLFRGTLRSLSYVAGVEKFLGSQHVLYKDFGVFAERLSDEIKQQAEAIARDHDRPLRYLASSEISKEDLARRIAQDDGISEGLVCVLTCVENCHSYGVRRDRERKLLRLVKMPRKCLHIYFYFVDREFGLMHVRLQTWLPFPIQVCLNGREYLARQLDQAKIGYEKRDNCFTRIDDLPRAQRILDRLTTRNWPRFLTPLGRRLNPLLRSRRLALLGYYWTWRQGEYATDVMFKNAAGLAEIYPRLVQHALTTFGSRDLLRFLGRRVNSRFSGEAKTDWHGRIEGTRVKHWVEENSLKMYDKQGMVLRIETTINNPRRFKSRRWGTRQGKRRLAWLPLRKAVADLPRLVEICRAANQRYLEALADVEVAQTVHRILDPVSQRIVHDGRSYRGLRPITAEEAAVFACLLDGKHRVGAIRNADVRRVLEANSNRGPANPRTTAGRATRWLRLLRAHGLVRKISGTHGYRLTRRGTNVMATAIRLREIDPTSMAA